MEVGRCVLSVFQCLLLLGISPNIALSDVTSSSFRCNQVGELFEGDLGSPIALFARPQTESTDSLCRRHKSEHSETCCSAETETKFSEVCEKRLKENVRTRHHALKKHLTNMLAKYQDRLDQLISEAENRTSVFLSRLHKIPWSQHQDVVHKFYSSLHASFSSATVDPSLDELIGEFFANVFPPVFNYVLTLQGQEEKRPISSEYQACLKRYAQQIQPFGNLPDVILKQLRHSVKHAVVFQDTLKTLSNAMTSTEAVAMDTSCRHALLRLQVCAGCRGVSRKGSEVKPCRGMCLNVMRGCLAKMSEVSSSWDDLVVAFENLQVGMLGRHDLQKNLLYLDMNISEAIMMAMDDSPRIYDEVKVKCRNLPSEGPSQQTGGIPPLVPDMISESIPPRNLHGLRSFQQEVKSLLRYLEDSKGQFNRLPDSLCQGEDFSQDMTSVTCWNGTSVGKYMEEVPEVNFLSQVRHNREVKVTLMDPDLEFLLVKESLTHMRRNLSSLLNSDIMLGDGPVYKNVAGTEEKEGSAYHPPVIVDDEDLVAYASGSGSGSGDDDVDDVGDVTDRPEDTKVITTAKPPDSSSHQTTASTFALLLCVAVHRLAHVFQ